MTTKICSKCRIEKPVDSFYKHRRHKDGIVPQCIECGKPRRRKFYKKNRARLIKFSAEWRRNNPEKARRSNFLSKYGLTLEALQDLKRDQDNRCAICKDVLKSEVGRVHVDHVQGSNPPVVRGILCNTCNTGLGKFGDDFFLLLRAASYLKKFLPSLLTG